MREILFRGKRIDNGEWVYGSLLDAKEDTYIIPHGYEYLYDEHEKLAFDVERCIVNPKTVGQSTGLIDKNGKKIFEEDIVKERVWKMLCDGAFKKVDEFSVVTFKEGMFSHCSQPMGRLTVEVIGNIHDNPDLLY